MLWDAVRELIFLRILERRCQSPALAAVKKKEGEGEKKQKKKNPPRSEQNYKRKTVGLKEMSEGSNRIQIGGGTRWCVCVGVGGVGG